MPFDRNRPFNDLPLLPPAVELESKAVLKQALSASRALAELKVAGALIPNQSVLLSSIALQEAKISSEIENIVTTNDLLYQALANQDDLSDPATKEVLSYNRALWFGFNALKSGRPISTRLIEEIGAIIKPSAGGIRRVPGTKIANAAREVIYTPPEGERVIRDKLANLEQFAYAENGLDPLVKMAVMHYQFEAIHPFSDGNGRTGRILNILYLTDAGLLEIPVLYLSRYIIENKTEYYTGLRAVTETQNWEAWIGYMLKAVEVTALETSEKIRAIHTQMQDTAKTVRQKLPKLYTKDLIELLFAQPYTKIRTLEQTGLVRNRQAASGILQKLAEIGVIEGTKRGKEWYYLNPTLLELLSK
jgi:Fic family protein